MIPVSVITGFLGSGKTTILSRLLRDPALADTAVIINEFGEIGLDHELIETSDENLVTLQTGCLCCKLQGDLVATLDDLLTRRRNGEINAFKRVVVETSGLADPAPILQSLILDEAAAANFVLQRVVTVVDAIAGADTLASRPEARKQVAVADALVLSKLDLLDQRPLVVRDAIEALNPSAPVRESERGQLDPVVLFGEGAQVDAEAKAELIRSLLDADEAAGGSHAHGEISTFAIVRDAPVEAVVLSLFLEALADHCGTDLLRLKGLIGIAEHPEAPAVIHGVQHVFAAPDWLGRWPSGDRRTRMVFIGRAISEAWVRALLDAIEAEVAELNAPSV